MGEQVGEGLERRWLKYWKDACVDCVNWVVRLRTIGRGCLCVPFFRLAVVLLNVRLNGIAWIRRRAAAVASGQQHSTLGALRAAMAINHSRVPSSLLTACKQYLIPTELT